MSNVKLNWELTDTKSLRAKSVFGQSYAVSGYAGVWSASRSEPVERLADGWSSVECRWAHSGVPSLEEAMALCQRDAEEQVKKIVDAGKPPSKFPNTLDASVWASRCTAWFGAFKVPDLADWFAAALQCGYLQGVGEADTKKYAPEDNLASKTWTKLEQLTNRLGKLEART